MPYENDSHSIARLRVASESIAEVGQPVSPVPSRPPPTPLQPNDMQLWYHQALAGNFERWLPARDVPGLPSTKLMTGTNRSMPLTLWLCASQVVVVTSVGMLESPERTCEMRPGMSDHWQVSGGSSHT